MTPVTEYIKNVGKSIKYIVIDEYLGDAAPATTKFLETNGELFTDIYHTTVHPFRTIKKVQTAITSNYLFRAVEKGFDNSINALKTGKLFDKAAEDAAFEESFGSFDDGEEDMKWNDDSGGSSPSDYSTGEKAIVKATTKSAEISTNAITGTVESSARYLGSISKANTTVLYKQAQMMSATMHHGFMSIGHGIDELNRFNSEVVNTLAQNANTYFKATTDIMKENNAILKEMLEMQRNTYKNADYNKNNEYKISDYQKIFGGGLNLKELGKIMGRNLAEFIDDESMGTLNEDTIKMASAALANPLSFIGTALIDTVMGPKFKNSLQKFDKTIKGAFGTLISKFMFEGENSDSFSKRLLGKIFGIKGLGKTEIDTSNRDRMGAIPFDWQTKRAITEVIPTYLSHIESALTGREARIYDDESGKWITKDKLREEYTEFVDRSKSSGFREAKDKMLYMSKAGFLNAGLADAEVREKMERIEEILNKVEDRAWKNKGHIDMRFEDNDTNAEEAQRFGISEKDVKYFKDLLVKLPNEIKTNIAGNILQSKDSFVHSLKEYEKNGKYNQLFNNSDADGVITSSVFDLNNMVDDYNNTIFDYLRSIDSKIVPGMPGGGLNSIGGSIAPTGPVPPANMPPIVSSTSFVNDASGLVLPYGARSQRNIESQDSSKKKTKELELTPKMEAAIAESIEKIKKEELEYDVNKINPDIVGKIAMVVGGADEFAQIMKLIYHDAKNSDNKTEEFLEKEYKSIYKEHVLKHGREIESVLQGPGNALASWLDDANDQVAAAVGMGKRVKLTSDEMKSSNSMNPLDSILTGFDNFFKRVGVTLDDFEKDKVKGFVKLFDGSIRELTGVSPKDIFKNSKDTLKSFAKESFNTVLSDTLSFFGIKDKKEEEEKIDPADVLVETTEKGKTPQLASGTRQVTKTGLAVLSPGEIVIPNSPAQQIKDYANEKKFISNLKGKLNNVQHYAFGNVTDRLFDALRDAIQAVREEFGSQEEQQPKTEENKENDEESESTVKAQVKDTIKQTKETVSEYKDRVLDLMYGSSSEEDRRKTDEKIKKATDEIKGSLTKIGGAGVLGLVGGTLLGGPLIGATLGISASMISNSNTLQKTLFGEDIVDENGKTTHKNGWLGDSGKDIQNALKKYVPDMGAYGAVGAVAGTLTGLGPLAGIMLGAGIGFAKNSEEVQKTLFGGRDGLITDETKALLKKHMPGMLKGGVASAIFGAMAGLGGVPLLGVAALGATLGMASTTDEFKDAILGKKDKDGKRVGGVLQSISDSAVTPFKDFSENFKKWFKEDFAGPIKRAIAPTGKALELGIKGIFGGIGKGVKWLFQNDTGIPFLEGLKHGRMAKAMGALGTVGKKAVGAAGSLVAMPSKFIGMLGDKAREMEIASGNANFMTAQERLEYMASRGKSGYELSELDSKMAGSSREQLEELNTQLEVFRKGKDAYTEKYNAKLSEIGSSVASGIKDTNLSEKIMTALKRNDVEKALSLVDKANIPLAQKEKMRAMIESESGKLLEYKRSEENYSGDREATRRFLEENGFKGINDDNIDKYQKLLEAELQPADERQKMLESESPEEKAAAEINTTLNDNFSLTIQELRKMNENLVAFAQAGKYITPEDAKMINNEMKRARNQNKEASSKYSKQRKDLQKHFKEKYGQDINDEAADKLIGTNTSKEKIQGVLGKDLKSRIERISKNNPGLLDVNKALTSELTDTEIERVITLGELGYKVDDYEKIKQSNCTSVEFENIKTLAEGGVKIDDFNAAKDLDPTIAQNMAFMASNGLGFVKQRMLYTLAVKYGEQFKADPSIREKIIAQVQGNKDVQFGENTENGISKQGGKTKSIFGEFKDTIKDAWHQSTSNIKDSFNDAKSSISEAGRLLAGGAAIEPHAFGDLVGSTMERLSTVSAGEIITKASDFAKKHKVGERLKNAANWIDSHSQKSGSTTSKGPTKKNSSPASSIHSAPVSTTSGGVQVNSVGQTMRKGTSGEYIVENTKANQKIQKAEEAKTQVQHDILDTLRQILAVNEDMANPGEKQPEKKGFLSKLLSLLGMFVPGKLIGYWNSAKTAFKAIEGTISNIGKIFGDLKGAMSLKGLSSISSDLFKKLSTIGKAMKGKKGIMAVAAAGLAALSLFKDDPDKEAAIKELMEKEGLSREQAEAMIEERGYTKKDSNLSRAQGAALTAGGVLLTNRNLRNEAIDQYKIYRRTNELSNVKREDRAALIAEKNRLKAQYIQAGMDPKQADILAKQNARQALASEEVYRERYRANEKAARSNKKALTKEQFNAFKSEQFELRDKLISRYEKMGLDPTEAAKRANMEAANEMNQKLVHGSKSPIKPTKTQTAARAFGLYNAYNTASSLWDYVMHPEEREKIKQDFDNASMLEQAMSIGGNIIGFNDLLNLGETSRMFAQGIGMENTYNKIASPLAKVGGYIAEKGKSLLGSGMETASNLAASATNPEGPVMSIVNGIMKRIDSILNSIANVIRPFGGETILKAIANGRERLVKAFTDPEIGGKILKSAGTILKKLALPLSIAFAAKAAWDGYFDCAEILELPKELSDPPTYVKCICAIFNSLYTLSPLGIIWDTFKKFLDFILDIFGLKDSFNKAIQEMAAGSKGILDDITDTISANVEEAKQILNQSEYVPEWMKTNNNMSGTDRILGMAESAFKFTPFGIAWAGAKQLEPMFNSVVDSTKNFFSGIFTSIQDSINEMLKPFEDTFKIISDTFNDTIDSIKDTFKNFWKPITTAFDDFKKSVKDFWNGLFGKDEKVNPNSPNTSLGRMVQGFINTYLAPSGGRSGKGKWGMGSYVGFHSQLDPSSSMRFNASGDTTYQNMADSGCGPVSAANIGSAFGIPMDSRDAASYALKKGYKEKDGGTKPEFFDDYLGKHGVETSNISSSETKRSLRSGHPVLLMGTDKSNNPMKEMYGRSKSPFGSNPHYVVATGIDKNDNITIQDPESRTPNKKFKANDVLSHSTLAKSARLGRWGRGRVPRYGMGSNGEFIWQYLKAKGLGSKSIAGIMGNLMAESGLEPDIVEGGSHAPEITVDGTTGYGLAQWTFIDRQQGLADFAKSRGKSSSDLETQLEYMLQEIGTDTDLLAKMENAKDEHEAALIFHREFERSADTPEMADRRGVYATEIAKTQGKGEAFGGTYKGSSSKPGIANQQSNQNKGIFGALASIKDMLGAMIGLGGSSSGLNGSSASVTHGTFNNGQVTPGSTQAGNKVIDLARQYLPDNKLGGPGHYSQFPEERENIDNGTADCSGFVNAIYQRAFGTDVAIANGFTGGGDDQMNSIPGVKFNDSSKASPGDVIFMDYGKDGRTGAENLAINRCDHVGLVTGNDKMIDIGNNRVGLSERSWDWVAGDNNQGSWAFIRPNLIAKQPEGAESSASVKSGKGKWGRGGIFDVIKNGTVGGGFMGSHQSLPINIPSGGNSLLSNLFSIISRPRTKKNAPDLLNKSLVNGVYEKNDIDYLISQGYSKEEAIEILSKHEKYKNKLKSLEERMTNQSFNLDNRTPKIVVSRTPATQPISNTASTALSNSSINYSDKFDKIISLLSVIAESLTGGANVQTASAGGASNSNQLMRNKVNDANTISYNNDVDIFTNIARNMNILAMK